MHHEKQTSQETIAAKRSAEYRAKKRITQEGVDELRAKARAYSKKYRMKKKALDEAGIAEKSAARQARKRMAAERLEEMRAKSRASSEKHRMKKKAAQGQMTKTSRLKKTAAERQADYRARKCTTLQGEIELREKSRVYNRKYRLNKKIEKLVLQTLLDDPELKQQPVGDVDINADEKALMNETLHDIEVTNLGPIESFGDFPELDEDALRGQNSW